MKIVYSVILILLFYGCESSSNSITGVYTTKNTKNTVDSLILERDGVYKRILRRKANNTLIFKHKGVWVYDGDRINLSDFLIDKDQIYKIRKSDSYFDDVLMTASLPVKTEDKEIIIAIDHKLNHFYIK